MADGIPCAPHFRTRDLSLWVLVRGRACSGTSLPKIQRDDESFGELKVIQEFQLHGRVQEGMSVPLTPGVFKG